MIEFEGKKFLNEQEAYLYCLEQIKIIKQSLGNALPDPIQGPQGETGADGPQGPEGPKGNGIYGCTANLPSATAYQEGDLYLLFNGQLYKKINGSWVMQTTLKGPQGPVGLPGGSEVVANPVDAATDELNKVKIDGTTYNIKDFTTSQVEHLKSIISNSFIYDAVYSKYVFDDVQVEFTYPAIFEGTVRINYQLWISDLSQIADSDGNPMVICENFKDSHGNSRFIEGEIDVTPVTGVTISYKKWSLSGSHLMFVVGGTIANGSTFSMYAVCQNFPEWIANKIVTLANENVRLSSTKAYGSDLSYQDIQIYLQKTGTVISIYCPSEVITADRNFCIQFDLLIDME